MTGLPLSGDAAVWRAYMTNHRTLFNESVRMAQRVIMNEIPLAEYRAWHRANVKPIHDAIRAEIAA